MAAKGSESKQEIFQKIAEVFGDRCLGMFSNNLYILMNEYGEDIQIKVALTAVKTPLDAEDFTPIGNSIKKSAPVSIGGTGRIDFTTPPVEDDGIPPWEDKPKKGDYEITPEERATVEDILAKLGL